MIYLRSKGGETLEDCCNRAINLAVSGDDVVEMSYIGTVVHVHPNWVATIAQAWREKKNEPTEKT